MKHERSTFMIVPRTLRIIGIGERCILRVAGEMTVMRIQSSEVIRILTGTGTETGTGEIMVTLIHNERGVGVGAEVTRNVLTKSPTVAEAGTAIVEAILTEIIIAIVSQIPFGGIRRIIRIRGSTADGLIKAEVNLRRLTGTVITANNR